MEFSQFPDKIQALLDFCLANHEDLNRFLCVMKHQTDEEGSFEQSAIVDIFEHNEFRNLLHLRLNFKRASDAETAQWLARKILV